MTSDDLEWPWCIWCMTHSTTQVSADAAPVDQLASIERRAVSLHAVAKHPVQDYPVSCSVQLLMTFFTMWH